MTIPRRPGLESLRTKINRGDFDDPVERAAWGREHPTDIVPTWFKVTVILLIALGLLWFTLSPHLPPIFQLHPTPPITQ